MHMQGWRNVVEGISCEYRSRAADVGDERVMKMAIGQKRNAADSGVDDNDDTDDKRFHHDEHACS